MILKPSSRANVLLNRLEFTGDREGTATLEVGVEFEISSFGSGFAILELPGLSFASTGSSPTASATFELPEFTINSSSGGYAALALGDLGLSSTAFIQDIGNCTLSFPAIEFTGTGIVDAIANATFSLPIIELSGIGYGGALADLALPILGMDAYAYATTAGSCTLSLPGMGMDADAFQGNVGYCYVELPGINLSALGETYTTATFTVSLPPLEILSLITDTVDTYAVNIATGGISKFNVNGFSKLLSAHGKLYGIRNGELIVFGGDTDFFSEIESEVRFSQQSFGINNVKRMDALYLDGRTVNKVIVDVIADEEQARRYQSAYTQGQSYLVHKIKTGKGVKFNTVGFALRNSSGGELDIGGIEVNLSKLSRRVR